MSRANADTRIIGGSCSRMRRRILYIPLCCMPLLCLLQCFVLQVPALQMCPGAGDSRTEHFPDANAQSVVFKNKHQLAAVLYWVNGRGSEVFMREIQAGESLSFTSYEGHVWRARAFAHGENDGKTSDETEVIVDFVVPPEKKTLSKGEKEVVFEIPKCGAPMHQALPYEMVQVRDEGLNLVLQSSFPACDALEFLGDNAVPGFYVLCANEFTRQIAVLTSTVDPIKVIQVPENATSSAQTLRLALQDTLELQDPWIRSFQGKKLESGYHRPFWQIYSTDGRYKANKWEHLVPNTVNPSGTTFLFEGGMFIWPGVRIGHKFQVHNVDGRDNVTLETLSLIPLVISIKGIFDEWECDHLIDIAGPYVAPSVVNKMDNDIGKPDTEWRTSKTHFIQRGQTDVVRALERRVRDITAIPISHGEGAQILRYGVNEHYHTHHDYFEPTAYSKSRRTLEMTEYGAANRMATVFWYLSTVPEGGETNFPRAGGKPRPTRSDKCYTGLKVKPMKGAVIIFYDMLPNGYTDEYSLHAGCDVECEECVKWSANKWLWNKQQNDRGWRGTEKDREIDAKEWPSDSKICELHEIVQYSSHEL